MPALLSIEPSLPYPHLPPRRSPGGGALSRIIRCRLGRRRGRDTCQARTHRSEPFNQPIDRPNGDFANFAGAMVLILLNGAGSAGETRRGGDLTATVPVSRSVPSGMDAGVPCVPAVALVRRVRVRSLSLRAGRILLRT